MIKDDLNQLAKKQFGDGVSVEENDKVWMLNFPGYGYARVLHKDRLEEDFIKATQITEKCCMCDSEFKPYMDTEKKWMRYYCSDCEEQALVDDANYEDEKEAREEEEYWLVRNGLVDRTP